LDNQRAFLDRIGSSLGVKTLEDWNNVSKIQFLRVGGALLLEQYDGSLINVLKTLYPDFDWKTKYKSRSYWKSLDNQCVFLNQIRSSLGIKNLNDWKNIFNVQFY
jgi:hypothetical protein